MGIIVIWLTGWHFFDPIFAIIVALFIMREAFELVKDAISPLLDSQVNEEEYNDLKDKLIIYTKQANIGFRNLRSRKSGSKHLIDFTILVEPEMTVEESHKICDELEQKLDKIYLETDISIHVEPLNK
jgi:cation diffusion facilitator family transporter